MFLGKLAFCLDKIGGNRVYWNEGSQVILGACQKLDVSWRGNEPSQQQNRKAAN